MKLEFFDRFSKNPQISDFIKICPVGDELFWQTATMKLIVAFHNFANVPNNRKEIQSNPNIPR
jgi:hypothetical protein